MNWGNVPTWIASIGTVGSLIALSMVAISTMNRDPLGAAIEMGGSRSCTGDEAAGRAP